MSVYYPAGSGQCPKHGGTNADYLVSQGWDIWNSRAQTAFNSAVEFLGDLSELNFTPVQTQVDFTVPGGLGVPFTKPQAPDLPTLQFELVEQPPTIPELEGVTTTNFSEPPEFEGQRPDINLPVKPAPFEGSDPSDESPTLSTVVVPDAPDLSIPEVPALREIDLPDPPDITLPTWEGERPAVDFVAPGDTFAFSEPVYETDLYDILEAKVQEFIDGEIGIPDAVWQQIWDKARSRELDAAEQAKQQAAEQWAARGFSLPPGALAAQVAEAQQNLQNAENQLSREQAIKEAELKRTAVEFGVTQGIALEQLNRELHLAQAERAFRVAQYAFEASVRVFEAKVAKYNAELEAYKTDASVYKTRIEAELAAVEVYKAELEGKRILGELNVQDVQVYKTRVDALLSHVEIYKGQLAGVQTQVDVDKARVDAFRAKVQAYGEQVNAYNGLLGAYAEEIKGETAKIGLYEADASAFASRVRAFGEETSARKTQQDLVLQRNEQLLKSFGAKIDRYKALLSAETSRINSGATVYEAQSRVYNAELQAEVSRVTADGQQYELTMRKGEAEANLALKEAEMHIQQILRLLSLEQDQNKIAAQVASQLASAALSAVSMSASVSASEGETSSCNTSYSYDMTA
jgi:hypothetical protein